MRDIKTPKAVKYEKLARYVQKFIFNVAIDIDTLRSVYITKQGATLDGKGEYFFKVDGQEYTGTLESIKHL